MTTEKVPRKWKTGDLVRLLSGGPVMTVKHEVSVPGFKVSETRCQWFTPDGLLHSGEFLQDSLVVADPPKAEPQRTR